MIINSQASASKSLIYYGGAWFDGVQANLQGSVVDCALTGIYLLPYTILDLYKTGFSGIYHIQGYSIDFAIVKNISVNNAGVGKYNFSVDIDGFNWNPTGISGLIGIPGILDPTNEWNISQQDDGQVQLSHNISARGISGSGSLGLAKQFVSGLRGLGGYNSGLMSLGVNVPCLLSSGFSENNINGVASITEQYILDPSGLTSGIIRYNVSCESSLDNVLITTINGDIFGCSHFITTGLYNSFDFSGTASGCLSGCVSGGISLINRNYNLDSTQKRITFTNVYSTDNSEVFIDYTTNTNIQSLTTIDINGTIRGHGDLKLRWQNVSEYYGGLPMIKSLIPSGISDFEFNPNPLNLSETFNSFLAEINFSASFNDRELPPEDFIKFDYTLNVVPPLEQFSAEPLLNQGGLYGINDLGFTSRGTISIQGQGIVESGISPFDKQDFIIDFMEQACLSSGTLNSEDYIKEAEEITINELSRRIAFSQQWTFKGITVLP